MAYTALARRYRSQSFDDLVGQEPIAQTLKAAIANDRVHHAYLFTGTRGVGKTSMARIFARALNAPDSMPNCPRPKGVTYPDKDVQGRMGEAIMRGEDMNVIEIDGASNRGVDDARQLIANASLAPTGNARFKVYIIDEVHMLTKDAFNTLLKTMEEPPSHLKFILCTTEPHKVLATIHSRCQRFDFRNIPIAKVAEHLRDVLKGEKIKADEAVIYQIARQANGSMRDGLSLLDRLLAGGETLTPELLERMLGLPDRQLIAALVGAIAASDAGASLKSADELLNRGIAQDQLLEGLIEHFRHMMILGACGPTSELVELDEASKQQAAEQSKSFDTPSLVHAIALLENVQRYSKMSSTPRAMLDAAVVRLAMSEKFADVAALLGGSGSGGGVDQKKKFPSPGDQPVGGRSPVLPPRPSPTVPPLAASRASAPQPVTAIPPVAQPVGATVSSPYSPSPQPPTPSPRRAQVVSQAERDQLAKLPLVKQIMEAFDARLVDVRQPQVEHPPAEE